MIYKSREFENKIEKEKFKQLYEKFKEILCNVFLRVMKRITIFNKLLKKK